MVCVALHLTIGSTVYAYRETISTLLFVLCVANLGQFRKLSTEVWLVLVFAAIVTITLMLPTPRRLYDSVGDLTAFQSEWPRLHQLRNATLYVPLIAYLSVRGISRREVRSLAISMILVVPVSLATYVGSVESVNLSNLAALGGGELGYLDYIPMLVFFGLASGYVLRSGGSAAHLICAGVCICIVVWISIVSSGRQNVMFVVLAAAIYALTVSRRYRMRAAVGVVALLLIASIASIMYVSVFGASEKLAARYDSFEGFADLDASKELHESSRYFLLVDGLLKLELGDLALGAGPEACEGPGPHCDYVRQIQRRGLMAALIGYAPFALALGRTFRRRQSLMLSAEDAWILLMLAFPLYYGIFGFPQDDAYKAFASFLGLGVALGVRRTREAKTFEIG